MKATRTTIAVGSVLAAGLAFGAAADEAKAQWFYPGYYCAAPVYYAPAPVVYAPPVVAAPVYYPPVYGTGFGFNYVHGPRFAHPVRYGRSFGFGFGYSRFR